MRLEEVLVVIEDKRERMVEIAVEKGISHDLTLSLSEELDQHLYEFQRLRSLQKE